MNLRFRLALIVVLFAASVVSACGGERNGRAAERLSRPEAIARIDELCRQTVERIERVGPQPAVGSATRPALDRYEHWLARVLAVTEAGLRQVERVPVPDDARQREIRAYVFWGRRTVSASRGLLRAVRADDQAAGERMSLQLDSSTDQARFAARRSDGDGISDGDEVKLSGQRSRESGQDFDPTKRDGDGDGLDDGQELALRTPPGDADADHHGGGGRGDGLSDADEVLRHGTDPAIADTDGDGDSDGEEVRSGTNPLVDERSLGRRVSTSLTDSILDNPLELIGGGAGLLVKKLDDVLAKIASLFRRAPKKAAENARRNLQEAAKRRLNAARQAPGASRTPPTANAVDNVSTLASPERTRHILHGEASGGGHLWPGLSGKTPFPREWSAARVMREISDVATDPASRVVARHGRRTVLESTRGGVKIRVVTDGQDIITGYPTNLPRNP